MSAFLYIMRYRHRHHFPRRRRPRHRQVTLVIVSGGHLYIILSLNDVTKSRDVTGCPIFSRPVRY